MKALKEKRVSLRSLFRRSLVILSLLALAFSVASCNTSGGGGDTDPSTPGATDPSEPPPPPPPPSGKYVTDIQVLRHPNKLSYEGAAPNLAGLQVAVFWDNNGTKEMTIEDTITNFIIDPPVTYLHRTAGTAVSSSTQLTDYGDYMLYYDAAPSKAKAVNVYLPAIVALAWNSTVSTLAITDTSATAANMPHIVMSGGFDKIWEDQPIKAGDVQMTARYLTITAGSAIVLPPDYGYESLSWDEPKLEGTLGTFTKTNSVTSSAAAWEVKRGTTTLDTGNEGYKMEYFPILEYKKWPREAVPNPFLVDIKTFYFVGKLEYIPNTAKLRNFFADEEDPAIGGTTIDWYAELKDSGARFKVIYYTGENQDLNGDSREIGMAEYYKAMLELNSEGRPRATYPTVTGMLDNAARANPALVRYSQSLIQQSVIRDFEVSIVLYYYHVGIGVGPTYPGAGPVPPPVVPGTPPPTWSVPNPGDITDAAQNGAVIPISDKIYIFDRFSEPQRIKNTQPFDNPQVYLVNGPGNNRTTMADLMKMTQLLYKVNYIYVDPNDSSKEDIYELNIPWSLVNQNAVRLTSVADWDSVNATNYFTGWVQATNWPVGGTPANYYTPIDYQLEVGEQGEFDVRFNAPRSDTGSDDVTFYYDVLP